MSLYTDLKKLVDKSNKEYLNQFMNHVQKDNTDPIFNNKVRDYISMFINITQTVFVPKKCQYIIQRGPNNGKQCSIQVKDINGSYCGKHVKHEVVKEVVEPQASDDDDEIIEEAPVASEGEEEEWFNGGDGDEF